MDLLYIHTNTSRRTAAKVGPIKRNPSLHFCDAGLVGRRIILFCCPSLPQSLESNVGAQVLQYLYLWASRILNLQPQDLIDLLVMNVSLFLPAAVSSLFKQFAIRRRRQDPSGHQVRTETVKKAFV